MDVKLRAYKKEFDYSYAIGVFPTLELLDARPEQVLQVLLSSQAGTNAGVAKIQRICAERNIPVEIADRAISRLSHSEKNYAIGILHKYEALLRPADNHLALVNPSDTGNLGTVIRAMLGFGLADLAVIRPAVDAFDPKVIRASMGAVFRIRFQYFDDFTAYNRQFGHHLYPFMTDGQAVLGEVAFAEPFTLVFGNESAGLPAEFHQLGTSVRIPQTAQVDSLNLAVSVGIALYQAAQQRPGLAAGA